MYRESLILIGKIIVSVAVYYLLDYLFGFVITLIIFIIILIFYIARGLSKGNDVSLYIEVACNPAKYIEEVEKRYKNKDVTILNLYRTYGKIFMGEFIDVDNILSQIDYSMLSNKEKIMFHEISLKNVFNNKDIELYKEMLESILSEGIEIEFPNEVEIFKIPILVMNESYDEIVSKLFELIPAQRKRLRIFELEYYLAIAYIELGKIEDANAILEFIIGKDLKFIYTEKAKTLFEKVK